MELLEVALPHLAFTLRKSQRLAIVGETGSGKSTLLKIIAGLVTPPEVTAPPGLAAPTNSNEPAGAAPASIFFEGARVSGPLERLIPGEPGIAYLSQHFELWHNYRVAEVLDYNNDLEPADARELYRLC